MRLSYIIVVLLFSICDLPSMAQLKLGDECPFVIDSTLSYYKKLTADSTKSDLKIFEYDSEGNTVLEIHKWDWDSTGIRWNSCNKTEIKYTEANLPIKYIFSYYDYDVGWVYRGKRIFEYDSLGNKSLWEEYYWNTILNDWVSEIRKKYDYTYDLVGRKTEEIYSEWHLDLHVWELKWQDTYTYDDNGRLNSHFRNKWAGIKWRNNYKWLYTYDSIPDNVRVTRYEWQEKWVLDYLEQYDYNLDDFTYLKRCKWDFSANDWIPLDSINREINDKGLVEVVTSYGWNSELNNWRPPHQLEYVYDQFGNIIKEATLRFDIDLDMWVWLREESHSHFLSQLSFKANISGETDIAPSGTYIYEVDDPGIINCDWYVTNGDILSYPTSNSVKVRWGETGNGNINVIAENMFGCLSDTANLVINFWPLDIRESTVFDRITMYPNPASSFLYIVTEKTHVYSIAITSLTGQLYYRSQINESSCQIDFSAYPTGVYIISIEAKEFVSVSRIIKQ